jgi:hypothetical protein
MGGVVVETIGFVGFIGVQRYPTGQFGIAVMGVHI